MTIDRPAEHLQITLAMKINLLDCCLIERGISYLLKHKLYIHINMLISEYLLDSYLIQHKHPAPTAPIVADTPS